MSLKEAIVEYSAILGKDKSLVQGAGGNISWKEKDVLWIKASGTWLKNALTHDIFIPLQLSRCKQLIKSNISDFSAAVLHTPSLHSQLRPSIETSLHALMPQTIVVHVHAIDIIANAVLKDGKSYFVKHLAGFNWAWIEYVKPGIELAREIIRVIGDNSPDIIILGNHGLIVAGETIEQVNELLQEVLFRSKVESRELTTLDPIVLDQLNNEWMDTGYCLPENLLLHSLALDPINLSLARNCWVMYPDHAIFLGECATIKDSVSPPKDFLLKMESMPPCIIIEEKGVVIKEDASVGQLAMLDCYLDVVSRLSDPSKVNIINSLQVAELLNWDAEKYRQIIDAQ